jgi:DNA-binding cell septation regulator SpoVG
LFLIIGITIFTGCNCQFGVISLLYQCEEFLALCFISLLYQSEEFFALCFIGFGVLAKCFKAVRVQARCFRVERRVNVYFGQNSIAKYSTAKSSTLVVKKNTKKKKIVNKNTKKKDKDDMEVDYSIGACEVLKDFKVSDLDIVDDKEVLFIKYPNKRSKDVLYKNINNLLKDLESVNSKGFVNELDISKYPIISDLAVSFTKHPKYLKGKEIFETYK